MTLTKRLQILSYIAGSSLYFRFALYSKLLPLSQPLSWYHRRKGLKKKPAIATNKNALKYLIKPKEERKKRKGVEGGFLVKPTSMDSGIDAICFCTHPFLVRPCGYPAVKRRRRRRVQKVRKGKRSEGNLAKTENIHLLPFFPSPSPLKKLQNESERTEKLR